MSKFISAIKTLVDDESGVTAIEYGLIAGLVGVAIIAGATALGTTLNKLFDDIGTMLAGITV
jgi:pilus assembly protein Flp/PilA